MGDFSFKFSLPVDISVFDETPTVERSGFNVAINNSERRLMWLAAAGDAIFVLNFAGKFLLDFWRGYLAQSKIQGGEFFTIQGSAAALIELSFIIHPFVPSAV